MTQMEFVQHLLGDARQALLLAGLALLLAVLALIVALWRRP